MADGNYVIMMRESLEKKASILTQIIVENEKQKDILNNPNALPEDLDETMERKASYIEELQQLDHGFEQLFSQTKDILQKQRQAFSGEITLMQALIRRITDDSARIQAQESENYTLAKTKFADIRGQVQKVRRSQQAVNTYYKNMMKVNYVDPQFMDDKK